MNAPVLSKSRTRTATADDLAAISDLHARVFGPGRFARSAYRVREGKGLLSRFCRVVEDGGRVVGSIRVTEISIGGASGAALLGPIAVDTGARSVGHGKTLIADALDDLRRAGVRLAVLVGDESYYGRTGFHPAPAGQISLPGPVDPKRILVAELEPGAINSFRGLIAAASSR
jgi:predicted N-acetyltransferase YhbS